MLAIPFALLVAWDTPCANPDDAAKSKPPAVGLRMSYTGRVQPVEASDEEAPGRTFRVSFLVTEVTAAGGCRVAWVIQDVAGGPRWPWAQAFGTVPLDPTLAATSDREGAAIQVASDGLVRVLAVRTPFFSGSERLAAGAQWEQGSVRFEVVGREDASGRPCWKVATSTSLGVQAIDWVDETQSLVVQHQESLTLGQGVPHLLTLELEKLETLSAEDAARQAKAHARLAELRGPLREKLSEASDALPKATAELLERARAAATEIEGSLKTGLYVDLARAALRETQTSLDRANAVAKLAAQIVGKPAPDFSLTTTRGTKLSLADLKGKPAVLHFWEYRSEPKVAPYGETGYLDYVFRQRERQGIRVVGVAVDERLGDEAKRPAARKDVRSFCEFMNLSYPVAYDPGDTIELFGDPRRVGGKLPLYVVIAPDGTVAEYHVGLWSASADEGLRELDQRLLKLVP